MNLADELLRHMQKPKRSHKAPKPPGPSVMAQAQRRLECALASLVGAQIRLAKARKTVETEASRERDARRKVERAQKALEEARKLAALAARIRRPLGE